MPLDELDELYRDIILDHYRNPRNHHLLDNPQLKAEGNNPFCGDDIILHAHLDDTGRILRVGFDGQGCSISQASASIMTEMLKGKTMDETQALANTFKAMMHGKELSAEQEEALGELTALEGVKKYPIRIKCALLAWTILLEGMERLQAQESR